MRLPNFVAMTPSRPLRRAEMSANPIEQFRLWFEKAKTVVPVEPSGVSLATAGKDSRPSSRMVLLKGFDDDGFVFYTNYNSRKGKQLLENPWAALMFWWPQLYQQVRIEGIVRKTSAEESDAYFATRPFGSQIGALASPQGELVEGRDVLQEAYAVLEQQWKGKSVPRPERWGGGYILNPTQFEFWQGQENRMHDRILYTRQDDGWNVARLAP